MNFRIYGFHGTFLKTSDTYFYFEFFDSFKPGFLSLFFCVATRNDAQVEKLSLPDTY